MKARRIKTTPVIEVEDVTLLSVEEAKKASRKTRLSKGWWWLRSAGDYYHDAAYVDEAGSIVDYGNYVDFGEGAVRPALKIKNLKSLHLKKFQFAGYGWTVIPGYALCDETVGHCAFRKDWLEDDANDYEKSDIRTWLQNWAKEKGIRTAESLTENSR